MKTSKHTESEMVKAIQKLEIGIQADVCRSGARQSDSTGCHRKKTIEPEVKKEITTEIIQEYSASIARACRLIKDDLPFLFLLYREER